MRGFRVSIGTQRYPLWARKRNPFVAMSDPAVFLVRIIDGLDHAQLIEPGIRKLRG